MVKKIKIPTDLSVKYNSAILFGSYARNDHNEYSDIDILLECDEREKSFSIGIMNFTIYTKEQLLEMASKGSLFILHIISEGQEITDSNILREIKTSFNKPVNYENYRQEIVFASDLLDVSKKEFEKYKINLNRLLYYLVRSFLYALSIDKGCNSFSIKEVCIFLGLPEYIFFFSNKNLNLDYIFFSDSLVFLANLFEHYPNNSYKSIELLLVNSQKDRYLLRIFGLRLLNKGNELIEYENLIK